MADIVQKGHDTPIQSWADVMFASLALGSLPIGRVDPAVEAASLVYEICGSATSSSDAAVVAAVPGIERQSAARLAVEMYQTSVNYRYCFIAGYHGLKRVADWFEQEAAVKHFGVTRLDGFRSQGHAVHAGHQAEWLAKQIVDAGAPAVRLIVPAFHMTRFYLTLLEALRRILNPNGDYPDVLVIPHVCPLDVDAHDLISTKVEKESGESDDPAANCFLNQVQVVAGEPWRIRDYQMVKKNGMPGDCLTTPRLALYADEIFGIR